MSGFSLLRASAASEVPEAALVRDLIYVFQGVDGQYVRYHSVEDAFCVDHQVCQQVGTPVHDFHDITAKSSTP